MRPGSEAAKAVDQVERQTATREELLDVLRGEVAEANERIRHLEEDLEAAESERAREKRRSHREDEETLDALSTLNRELRRIENGMESRIEASVIKNLQAQAKLDAEKAGAEGAQDVLKKHGRVIGAREVLQALVTIAAAVAAAWRFLQGGP